MKVMFEIRAGSLSFAVYALVIPVKGMAVACGQKTVLKHVRVDRYLHRSLPRVHAVRVARHCLVAPREMAALSCTLGILM